ncbi:MAG TPA: branched-chain amino acid ABC transporter permease [Galbitalea sp.]|jgi:branched-chain amino acid transport system permease protein|nr:branched-chain amino acid ABC transporter permease [Galbitalea sp.]
MALAYWENILIFALIAITLASALNIPMGLGGMYVAGMGALYGVGAYTTALVAGHVSSSLFVTAIAAIILAAAAGAIFIIPAVRARYEYFMVASLGLQYVASTVFVNSAFVGGTNGLTGFPAPTVFGATLSTPNDFLIFAAIAAIISVGTVALLRSSPVGRRMRAVRDDERAAESLAVSPLSARSLSLIIGGALAGLAGCVYAYYVGFINPDSFDFQQSVLVFTMVILGGAGTVWGPVVGAVIISALPPALTFLNFVPPADQASLGQIIYGVLLVAMVIFRPEGLISDTSRFGRKNPGRQEQLK